ncbi:MAG: ester cyclase [Thermoplasmata archaeon]
MSVEENIRATEAGFEAFKARDWDRLDELNAESVVNTGPDLPEPVKGRDALLEYWKTFVNAFPDANIEDLRTFGQGDLVVAEFIGTGTHNGPLPGPGGQTIPATNKAVRLPLCFVFKVEGGKTTELRRYYDLLGLMTQLGLAP